MGKKTILVILIVLVLGVGLGVGGSIIAQMFFLKSTPTTSKEAVVKSKATHSSGLVDNEGPLVPVGDFTLNLQGGSFLKIAITVEGINAKSEELLKSRLAFLKDTVIVVLTDKPLVDVQTPAAMEKLREELMTKLNEVAQDKIVNVLYESFVYQ
ncbi:MAG: flagellar basal body-associated FliL family protein [Desulfitobacteriaceae bacterium]